MCSSDLGQVEATEVHVSAAVGGRVVTMAVNEGSRVTPGATIATLDTADAELAIARVQAERAQADAQLRLLLAGARPEEIRQAEAQVAAAAAERAAAEVDVRVADGDAERFDQLFLANSGSRKQRDDAVGRRDAAQQRLAASRWRQDAAAEALARLRAGAQIGRAHV